MTRPPRARRRAHAAWAVYFVVAASATAASGQAIDVEQPSTLVVGSPSGGARMDRVNGARTGLARTTLPTSGLHVEWEASLGVQTEQAPLVDSRGGIYVVGARGEVVMLARDGTERWRVATAGSRPSPAALLSDDTVVFVETTSAGGSAVGVRDGRVTWRTHVGRGEAAPPSPLATDDGGVVVATGGDLAILDAQGRERSRTTLGEMIAMPLISAVGRVVAVTGTGVVWTWIPGAPEPVRVASFGSAVDGSAALVDDHTLLAVTSGRTHLTAVDLVSGAVTTRASSHGALWSGSPAIRGSLSTMVAVTPASELGIVLDPTGREIARAVLEVRNLPSGTDAGAAAFLPASPTPGVVDSSGTFVFATAEGRLGVAPQMTAGDGTVELLATPCPQPVGVAGAKGASPVAGIAPLSEGAFVATCRSGAVLAVVGASSSGESRPQHL